MTDDPKPRTPAKPQGRAVPPEYNVGQRLYFTGSCNDLENGDRVIYGLSGEVQGPATHPTFKGGMAMKFPGNRKVIDCPLSWLSPKVRITTAFALCLGLTHHITATRT